MEAARWCGVLLAEDEQYKSAIPSGVVSGLIRDALMKFLTAMADLNIAGPAVASVALLDLAGRKFFYQPRGYFTQRNAADRSNLILPEVWIENPAALKAPDEIIRPLLDILWQCFDLNQCYFYNDQGIWDMH